MDVDFTDQLMAQLHGPEPLDEDAGLRRKESRPTERLQALPSIPGPVKTPLIPASTPALDPFARWEPLGDQPPSDLPLDQRSREHLTALIKQATENAGVVKSTTVEDERGQWENILVDMLAGGSAPPVASAGPSGSEALVDVFNEVTLDRFVKTDLIISTAERLVQAEEAAEKDKKGKGKAKDPKKPTASEGSSKEGAKAGAGAASEEGPSRTYETGTPQDEKPSPSSVEHEEELVRRLDHQRRVRSKIASLLRPEAEGSPPKPPDLRPVRLVLHLQLIETRHRAEPREARFVNGKWEGNDRLFGESATHVLDRCEEDDKDILDVERVGGTVTVKGPSRELRRMHKVIELAIFAACNLKLEVHLLRDAQCARPPPPPPTPPPPPSIELPEAGLSDSTPPLSPTSATSHDASTIAPPGSIGSTSRSTLPGAFPDSPARPPGSSGTSGSGRARWSRSGLWGILLGRPDPTSEPGVVGWGTESPRPSSDAAERPSLLHTSKTSDSSSSHRARLRQKAFELRKRLGVGRGSIKRRGYTRDAEWEALADHRPADHHVLGDESASETEADKMHEGAPSGDRHLKVEAMKKQLAVSPGKPRPSADSQDEAPGSATLSVASSFPSPDPASGSARPSAAFEDEEPADRFERVMKRMEKAILSISPDVVFPPPHLLVRLRQQEIADSAIETAQLGKGVRPNFDRQRSFAHADAEALSAGFAGLSEPDGGRSDSLPSNSTPASPATFSKATGAGVRKITVDARAGLASLLTNNSSLDGTIRHQSMLFLHERSSLFASPGTQTCEPPHWLSLRYYEGRSGCGLHGTIGQVIDGMIAGHGTLCKAPGCGRPMADHAISLVHNVNRVTITVANKDDRQPLPTRREGSDEHAIAMWTRCQRCGACAQPAVASQATLLYSFAKYLELIIYGDRFLPSAEALCEHGEEQHDALVRYFSRGKTVVAVALQPVELYELRLPTAVDATIGIDDDDTVTEDHDHELDPLVQELGQEITAFFDSTRRRIKVLESSFARAADAPSRHESVSSAASSISSLASSSASEDAEEFDALPASQSVISRGRSKTIKASLVDRQLLLENMQSTFRTDELDLRSQLPTTNASAINNLRKPFVDRLVAARGRLFAWEKKHLPELPRDERTQLELPSLVEPAYAAENVHALPADNSVLVRTDELSSIIAFTLSSSHYQQQIEANKARKAGGTRRAPSSLAPPTAAHLPSKRDFSLPASFFAQSEGLPDVPSSKPSPAASPKLRPTTGKGGANPDPDDEEADFAGDLSFEAFAKPKKPLKQASSILSLRALSRQRSFDPSSFKPFGSLNNTPSKTAGTVTPTGEDAKKASNDGQKDGQDDKILDNLIKNTAENEPPPKTTPAVAPAPVAALLSRGLRAPPSASLDVYSTPPKVIRRTPSTLSQTDTLHGKDATLPTPLEAPEAEESFEVLGDADIEQTPPASRNASQHHRSGSSILSPLNALWSIGSMKLRNGEVPKDMGLDGDSPSPHIKYRFLHGTKEFTCTCWFAEEFESIRHKAGISDRDFYVNSLSRCTPWNPVGGKSKALFLITKDQRFLLKESVMAWNVSERDALLAFAPSYFAYLHSQTNQKPSLLTKLFGFYTVKIRDTTKDGNLVKLDLLLLENLFHASSITRKFDLKGISTRVAKVKPAEEETGGHTGWDADWLEGSLRTLLLIHPHSKSVIASAIENDTAFLADSNVMDYSLLVGISDTTHELIVGLIDVIGTFNLAKMIESRGKMALKSSDRKGEVTILPPSEYAARFRKAMETYILAVPEKFSRPTECLPEDRYWAEHPTLPSVL